MMYSSGANDQPGRGLATPARCYQPTTSHQYQYQYQYTATVPAPAPVLQDGTTTQMTGQGVSNTCTVLPTNLPATGTSSSNVSRFFLLPTFLTNVH